jgi:hypothetical protein
VYDVVLVDEAQFFAPIWFEIIKRIVKPRVGICFWRLIPRRAFLSEAVVKARAEVRGRTQDGEELPHHARDPTCHAALPHAGLMMTRRLLRPTLICWAGLRPLSSL